MPPAAPLARIAPLAAAPLFAIRGWSGSGKTTLICDLIPLLRSQGLTIGVVKHAHHPLKDDPDTDSSRFEAAGASAVVVIEGETGTDELLRTGMAGAPMEIDCWLVEGFKTVPLDGLEVKEGESRIEVHQALAMILGWLPRAWASRPSSTGILVGGSGRRMGQPKRLLQQKQSSLLAQTLTSINSFKANPVLIGAGILPFDVVQSTRFDDAPNLAGPLAGVLGAHRARPWTTWMILGCDFPLMTADALAWLWGQRAPGRWAIWPVLEGRAIPVAAIYEPQIVPTLERAAANGERSLTRILQPHPSCCQIAIPAQHQQAFRSANTPEEWEALTGEPIT
ncbi:MAG: molybdopterin-guanine dinucleotide biosynthesis protein B [bacterium]